MVRALCFFVAVCCLSVCLGGDAWFGAAVDISGDWAVVGAPHEVDSDGEVRDGDWAAVSSPWDNSRRNPIHEHHNEAVTVFHYENGSWSVFQVILYLRAVALALGGDGHVLALACPDSPGSAVTIWRLDDAAQQYDWTDSIAGSNDLQMGHSVDISADGGTIVSGGGYYEAVSGAAQVFEYHKGFWRPVGYPMDVAIREKYDHFIKTAISPDGTYVAVGVPSLNIEQGHYQPGTVHVFSRDPRDNPDPFPGMTYIEIQRLEGESYRDLFGFALAFDGTRGKVQPDGGEEAVLAVGAPYADDGKGTMYVYHMTAGETQFAKVASQRVSSETALGYSLAVQGDTLLVGAPWYDSVHASSGRGPQYSTADHHDSGEVGVFKLSL
ncbi:hypothetical protein KIPB_003159 [Kipferlia bialata]|uniref:Uncharacterized protein n=1 Tax=Kipferlia bialata TaxID=797122 RepID=A0A9K3GFL0_9EUKA|nr:hypothetical protein KIPB_003159 [Kipferlia bialata]|eukprot:g3159.t1